MPNKVYFFTAKDGNGGGYFVAEENFKEAKNKALLTDVCAMCDNPFVDIRGHLVKEHYFDGKFHEKGRKIITKYEGILNVKELCELDLLWWDCPECGGHNFLFKDKKGDNYNKYLCNDCGFRSEVPYIDF